MLRKIQYDSSKPVFLDIGCKDLRRKGYVGIDILNFGQEIVWDIRYGIPFPDNSVTGIYCSHLLEHLENRDIQDFFIEIYRVCKDRAEIEIRTPHSQTIEACYACHLSLWDETRIQGILRGLAHKYKYTIKDCRRQDKELLATLIVEKEEN